jgi:drug/metabolite transporter (DMT)-like permease
LNDTSKKGLLYMLGAAFCFSISGACTKVLGKRISSVELVFFRNIIGVIFVLVTIYRQPLVQIGGKMSLLVFRGIIGTLALYTFFFSITKIGLAEAITYQQSYPIILALLGGYFLKEKLDTKNWIAVIVGFVGICCIFLPQFKIDIASIKYHSFGLANAIMTALAYMSIKQLSSYYDSRSIVLSFMFSGIVLPIISMVLGQYIYIDSLAFLFGGFNWPAGIEWLWIGVLALSALAGQILLTKAFTFGNTGEVSAIGYSNIVFSVVFGILLGDAFPNAVSLLGILLIIACGVYISFRKNELKPAD